MKNLIATILLFASFNSKSCTFVEQKIQEFKFSVQEYNYKKRDLHTSKIALVVCVLLTFGAIRAHQKSVKLFNKEWRKLKSQK